MIRATRRFLVARAAAAVDLAFTRATDTLGRSRDRGVEAVDHETRLQHLAAIADAYPETTRGYFRPARTIRPTREPVSGDPGVADLIWESDYTTCHPAMAERFAAARENGWVTARHLSAGRRGAPRPVLILVHGYLGGNFTVERQVFPVEWLLGLGLDVVLFTLPFHGRRAEAGRRLPRFPGRDPRVTLEGFRQAAGDLVDLFEHLLAAGHPSVGLMGMSLGGYTTSLLATLEPRMSCAVALIPLASFADWAQEQGRLSPEPAAAAREHAALERAYRLVSPLSREPVVAPARVLVMAAQHDRITPPRHAERLAAHFRVPLLTFAGGHLLQLGRERALQHLAVMLRDQGVIPRA